MSARLFLAGAIGIPGRSSRGDDAILVQAGRIVAVGPRSRLARNGGGLRVVDFGGARILPAFHDAHVHLSTGSVAMSGVDLRGVVDADEAQRMVRQRSDAAAASDWILGFGWTTALWPPGASVRARLDEAGKGRPVLLSRMDGHAAWLSSVALAALAVGRERRDDEPPGVERDPTTGEPTGLVQERAAEELRRRAPLPRVEERDEAIARALRTAARSGIARIEDVTETWALPTYRRLRDEGRLRCRIRAWLPIEADRDEAEHWRRSFPPDDPWVEVATLKVFLDGVMEGRTAALLDPYADRANRSGELRWDGRDLLRVVLDADRADWQIAFHAIGDRAVRQAIEILEKLPARSRRRPHRIEHAQLVANEDRRRIAAVGAAVGVQPAQWLNDRVWLAERLGVERGSRAHPWGRLAAAGIVLAAGSDWPVGSLDPAVALAAVRERDDRSFTTADLLEAYTQGAAAAAGRRPGWGRIAPGEAADFVVFDEAIDAWSGLRATYVDGHPSFEQGEALV